MLRDLGAVQTGIPLLDTPEFCHRMGCSCCRYKFDSSHSSTSWFQLFLLGISRCSMFFAPHRLELLDDSADFLCVAAIDDEQGIRGVDHGDVI
jgi:hypothetical protein